MRNKGNSLLTTDVEVDLVFRSLIEAKQRLVDLLGLPVEEANEVNFATWEKPYRISRKVATLWLYHRTPKKSDPGSLYATRDILGMKRPFGEAGPVVIQTIEGMIHTFYLLPRDGDLFPEESFPEKENEG